MYFPIVFVTPVNKKKGVFSKVHIFYIVPLQGQGVNSPSIRVYGRRLFEGAGILVFKVIVLLSQKRNHHLTSFWDFFFFNHLKHIEV